jgi:RimJ/RimL family protein N-acetyltransferase
LNPRALHLYRKLGFRERGHFWRGAPVGYILPTDKPGAVRRRQIRFIEMVLRARAWVGAESSPD